MSERHQAVFLSYASQDADAARRICDALRHAGVEVWFDADGGLEQGDEWDAKIRKQIKECVLFVPIISANTQARLEGYFRIEWDLAAERARGIASGVPFILPVVIDDTREPEAFVPDRFRTVQWTRLPGGNVPPDVLQRFLKLWSHRVGAVSHQAVVGASLSSRQSLAEADDDARGRAQGAPLHERPSWLLPATIGTAVVAIGATLWLTLGSARKPAGEIQAHSTQAAGTEDRRLIAQVWKLLYDHGMARAQLDSAEQLCRRAAEIAPTNPDVWAAWAHVNTWFVFHRFDDSTSRREAARDYATRAMQFAPQSFEARLAQAFYWHRGGSVVESQLRTAKEMLRALNEERPDDPRVMLILGTLLLRSGEDWESGRKLLERLGEGTSLAAVALMELGYTLHFAGRFSDAERAIDRSIAAGVYWNNLSLKVRLALYWHGDLEAAKAWMARMPPADMQEDFAVATKSDVDLWSREPELAIRLLLAHPRDWLDSNPYDGPKALLLGEARLMAGREESARLDFQLALELTESRLKQDPNDARLLQHKAVALHFLGDQEGASKAARQSRDNGLSSRSFERLSMLLQPPEELLDSLEAGFDSPTQLTTAAALRLNPRLDRLRANPRFQALLARAEASPLHTPNPKVTALPAVSEKSVAVLAFANTSPDSDNAYFSDGISEELGNVLGKVPGLKVTARTSAFYFKGKDVPVAEIARRLGVTYVVNGSVRKQGSFVRISAELIHANNGEVVWSSGTLERELKDMFAVQDEIAGLIAEQLQLKLGFARTAVAVGADALQAFLEARALWNVRSSESLARMESLLSRVLEVESRFAPAEAGLAYVWATRSLSAAQAARHIPNEMDRVEYHAKRALEIDPNSAEALEALGTVAMLRGRLSESEVALRRAVESNPNYAAGWGRLGWLLERQGRLDEALECHLRARTLDPLAQPILDGLERVSNELGKTSETLALHETVRDDSPMPPLWTNIGMAHLLAGRSTEALDAARAALGRNEGNDWDPGMLVAVQSLAAWILVEGGAREEAEVVVRQTLAKPEAMRWSAGLPLLAMGRKDEAYTLLANTPQQLVVIFWVVTARRLELRDDPRFRRLLDELNATEAFQRVESRRKQAAAMERL